MFDVCCNFLDKGTNVKLLINKTTCFTSHFNFNEQENSEHFKKTAPKGIRTNFFYVTGTSIGNINADDNGAYQNTRKATRTYSYIQGNVIAYEETEIVTSIKEFRSIKFQVLCSCGKSHHPLSKLCKVKKFFQQEQL